MSLTEERYKQLMADVGMPNSRSLLQALQQVANEVEQKCAADKRVLDDLASLSFQLVRALRKASPDNDLAERALDYLKREGLTGSPLRAIEAEATKQQPQELEALSVGNKEGMVLVTKEDAENYCRILSLLGMEEEGSPIEDVERLISLRDGMTCGDCNDTGWLENREEGRYPCTCMTEAEPYQILEAERDDWKSRYESNLSVNQMHSDNNAEMLKFNAKLLSDIDALKKQNNAYSTLTKSQEGRLFEYGGQQAKWLDAFATLDSEKEANAILTQERDALAMQNRQMREALEYCVEDSRQVLTELEQAYGTVYRQNRVKDQRNDVDRAVAALALPTLSAEVIKRHDAEVLRKAEAYLKSWDCYVGESLVKRLIAELEKS